MCCCKCGVSLVRGAEITLCKQRRLLGDVHLSACRDSIVCFLNLLTAVHMFHFVRGVIKAASIDE